MTEVWEDPAFLAEAVSWVDEKLAGLGLARTGDVEQPHVRSWSTVLRVPTAAGPVWFKANAPAFAHEVLVVDRVSRPRARAGAAAPGPRPRPGLDAHGRRGGAVARGGGR